MENYVKYAICDRGFGQQPASAISLRPSQWKILLAKEWEFGNVFKNLADEFLGRCRSNLASWARRNWSSEVKARLKLLVDMISKLDQEQADRLFYAAHCVESTGNTNCTPSAFDTQETPVVVPELCEQPVPGVLADDNHGVPRVPDDDVTPCAEELPILWRRIVAMATPCGEELPPRASLVLPPIQAPSPRSIYVVDRRNGNFQYIFANDTDGNSDSHCFGDVKLLPRTLTVYSHDNVKYTVENYFENYRHSISISLDAKQWQSVLTQFVESSDLSDECYALVHQFSEISKGVSETFEKVAKLRIKILVRMFDLLKTEQKQALKTATESLTS